MGDHTAIDVAVVGMYGRAEELCGHRGNRNVRLINSEAKVSWTRAAGLRGMTPSSSPQAHVLLLLHVFR
jgi:hypothetical protein